MRGEYPSSSIQRLYIPELPPRARRILDFFDQQGATSGTTSACAENTVGKADSVANSWNYLRVRGEYFMAAKSLPRVVELPPRARRIRAHPDSANTNGGTTSACAENTPFCPVGALVDGNYLRVRGEYGADHQWAGIESELPPRARRIPLKANKDETGKGTTSACAENTPPRSRIRQGTGNYLRVRGEYLNHEALAPYACGTTSACAENT